MATNERFSKKLVARVLREHFEAAKSEYQREAGKPIDDGDGTDQIPEGRPDAAVAYGRYNTLIRLFNDLELE